MSHFPVNRSPTEAEAEERGYNYIIGRIVMKANINNEQGQNLPSRPVAEMRTVKEAPGRLNDERWLNRPNKITKPQDSELGRRKRTW